MNQSQAFIGILMLDTEFQRVPGDVGNHTTFNYPVRYKIIKGATPMQIVNVECPDKILVDRFIEGAQELEAQGAVGLISSCGFLSILQDEVAQSVSIPVILSSLNLIPLLQSSAGHKRVGVITADQTQLSAQALSNVNILPDSVCVIGMQSSSAFTQFIFGSADKKPDKLSLSNDLVTIANTLLSIHPQISVIVLECTNLQPYAASLNKALQLPIVGIVNAANLLWEMSSPRDYL